MSDAMSPASLSRRSLLGLAAGTSVLAITGRAQAQTQVQAAAYSRVSADVATLREAGLGRYAEFVRVNLDSALQSAFAGRTGVRGAPALVVKLSGVQLSAYAGGGFGGFDSASSDFMTGEAFVLTGGSVSRRYPQVISSPAGPGGSWADEGGEQRRTAVLCQNYAAWLARAL